MKADAIRKVLLNPHDAIEALALREAVQHARILSWASVDPNLAYLESMERAAILILDSGPTAMRDEFVLYPDRQTPLCQGVLDCRGLYGYKNGLLTWIAL